MRWLKAPFRKGVGSNPTGVIAVNVCVSLLHECVIVVVKRTHKGKQQQASSNSQAVETSAAEPLGFAHLGSIPAPPAPLLFSGSPLPRLIFRIPAASHHFRGRGEDGLFRRRLWTTGPPRGIHKSHASSGEGAV